MKRVLVIAILIVLFSSSRNFAFVSPITSPLEQGYPPTYLGFTPLDGCKISCVLDYIKCYRQCEELYGVPEIGAEELLIETAQEEISSMNTTHSYTLPVFIQQRRWPILNINPGNTNCTYFTDGTKYCR